MQNQNPFDATGRVTASSSRDGDDNPFRVPSDELIFTFKEDEKRRKIDEKETNKHRKIW